MEMPVESQRWSTAGAKPALAVQLLGPLAITRDGSRLTLPGSRKLRALFAYLALAPQPVPRSALCDLLWDVPNDPRGELRWCLSRIRALIDEPGRRRVRSEGDAVALDLSDCHVDAIEVARAVQQGVAALDVDRAGELATLFIGEPLDRLEIERAPAFDSWLTAQRRRFRACRAALLEHLARTAPEAERLDHLERWREAAPLDLAMHGLLFSALARHGRFQDGEAHLAASLRLFEAEELDCAPLRALWRSARQQAETRVPASAAAGVPPETPVAPPRRASIAVMPFTEASGLPSSCGSAAGALAHDVITRLAKLRSLFVIAQGTVFTLHERSIGAEQAGRMLDADYVVSGALRQAGQRLTVTVELVETRSARILWAEAYDQPLIDAFLILDEIGDGIVAAVASEIETAERNRAILKPPNSLDAWEAHHCGLWHMYRFNQADNATARHFFEMAVGLDPTFARAHAGLSFTHFQSAFQGWEERNGAVDRAFAAAGQSLMVDDRDPAAHWAMGRALWLRGRPEQSIAELEQAVDLSPNFAQGHYALAFVHSQLGDPVAAISSSDHSRRLSPYDPMLFAMLGARAMALVRLGRFEEAADWSLKAATRPNAHAQIMAIASFSLALAGRLDEARSHLAAIRRSLPHYGIADFFTAMRFSPADEALFRTGARRIGEG